MARPTPAATDMEPSSRSSPSFSPFATMAIVAALVAAGSASVRADEGPASGASLSANRVGYGAPRYADPTQSTISDAVVKRVGANFSDDAAVTMVRVTFADADAEPGAATLQELCAERRVNAIVLADVKWQGYGAANRYSRPQDIHVTVGLKFSDCSGEVLFSGSRTKTTQAYFSKDTADQLAGGIATDATDELLADVKATFAKRKALWDGLLQSGLPLDPGDGKFHGLWSPEASKDGGYRVAAIFRGGPAAVAGLKVGDVVRSIDGKDLKGLSRADVLALLDVADATLVVDRTEGQTTIVVHNKKYADLVSTLGR